VDVVRLHVGKAGHLARNDKGGKRLGLRLRYGGRLGRRGGKGRLFRCHLRHDLRCSLRRAFSQREQIGRDLAGRGFGLLDPGLARRTTGLGLGVGPVSSGRRRRGFGRGVALFFLRGLRVGAVGVAGGAASVRSASGAGFSSSLMLDRPPLARPEKRGSQDSTKPFQAAAGRLDPPPTLRVFSIFYLGSSSCPRARNPAERGPSALARQQHPGDTMKTKHLIAFALALATTGGAALAGDDHGGPVTPSPTPRAPRRPRPVTATGAGSA
jgi:hypothetical protein